ncbi:YciI family protein [Falsirhodobacter deserti]|uniref:YciI family protein n=1 Tax=Falsirhodobacter deserti TaxID=1365611 RepID=UPI000FE3C143|nr:YciI family protein [Falsirhodobacter deserti]
MYAALICRDKPDSLDLRMGNREAHLDYVARTGVVEFAGPFLNDAGEMCGSLIILNVDSMEDAHAWAKADPYAKAGLFAQVEVNAWKKVIG